MPSLYDVIRMHAGTFPEKLALITEQDGSRTYEQLATAGGQLGWAFTSQLGLRLGDRVCLWMVNRPEWVETMVGLTAAGLPSVPANPEWADAEIEFILRHSRCRALVCDRNLAERAMALRERIDGLDHVLVPGPRLSAELRSFDEVFDAAPADPSGSLPNVEGSAEGSIVYTSGTTTGRPKGVVASAELLSGSSISYEEMFGLRHTDRVMFVTPLFHGNGAGACLSAITRGASAVFPRRFSASRFWGLVDTYRPTYLFTLVPIVNILLGLPPSAVERSHTFRVLIVLGSGPAAEQIEERFGAPVIDWYGMTEAGTGTYTRLGEARRPGSAGKPFEGSEMRILREDGTPAGPGEVGEVAFRASSIGFLGYADDPEATAASLRDGWFFTGDLGRVDEDGYFYFVDRKKDIVRRGGENISTIEVETVLRDHPDVGDVAVVGRPDPVLGERMVAFVVPAPGRDAPGPDALRAFAEGRLAAFKVPEEVVTVGDLPRTGTGKVEKFRLRDQLGERRPG